MLNHAINYIKLPNNMSDFERTYLARMNRVAFWFFACHLPVFALIAWLNDTGPALALALTTFTLLGPTLAMRCWTSQRPISVVMGVTAMFMGGLLVHFGQGPVQIEMHFYFFVLLALLAVFANPMVIIAAAITAALHHGLLWWLLPSSVFNYDAPIWVVGVHAAFVILESVAACFIARSFFDNVIGLELKVAARTSELAARNKDMRMLLDAVEQGFFTVDAYGEMSEERSAAVEALLGPTDGRTSLAEVVRQHDGKAADWLALGLEDAFGGIMPIETTLDQLPDRIKANGLTLSLDYTPVTNEGEVTAIAVVVSDVSAEVEKERLEAEMREMMEMIDRISRDRIGFLEFFQEAEANIEALKQRDSLELQIVKRKVHTLKGNAAIFGINRVAEACHELEDYIAEFDRMPEDPLWTRLFGCWASTRGNLRRISSDENTELSLDGDEYKALLLGILNAESKDVLATRVAAWKLEPTRRRLERIAEQTRQLASRLNKGGVRVEIEDGGLRTDPETWSDFWSSIVHVVRNAVDHGLEERDARVNAGKSEAGTVRLKTALAESAYVISVTDDGRGINWNKIRSIAEQRGLPATTQNDLVDAIFADGLSTSESVSDISGRGVGMAAVKAACEALGGRIEIDTEEGRGTRFRFIFRQEAMAPETVKLLRDHGVRNPHRVSRMEASPTTTV